MGSISELIQSNTTPLIERIALFPRKVSLNFGQNKPTVAQSIEMLERREARKAHFLQCLKNFLMIPVVPLVGYFCLDQTGVTALMTQHSPMMHHIMGEGFGHIGACFSLHYVFKSFSHFGKAIKGTPLSETSEHHC